MGCGASATAAPSDPPLTPSTDSPNKHAKAPPTKTSADAAAAHHVAEPITPEPPRPEPRVAPKPSSPNDEEASTPAANVTNESSATPRKKGEDDRLDERDARLVSAEGTVDAAAVDDDATTQPTKNDDLDVHQEMPIKSPPATAAEGRSGGESDERRETATEAERGWGGDESDDEFDHDGLMRERAAAAVLNGDADASILERTAGDGDVADGGDALVVGGKDEDDEEDVADAAALPAAVAAVVASHAPSQAAGSPVRLSPAQTRALLSATAEGADGESGNSSPAAEPPWYPCDAPDSPEVVIKPKVFVRPDGGTTHSPPVGHRPGSPVLPQTPACASPIRATEYAVRIDAGGPLTEEEYRDRLITSGGPQEVRVPLPEGGHYTLRYAYVSQRGYYPGQPTKANQDALCTHTYFGGNEDEHVFGVFDGHGERGTECAEFAMERVPKNLLKDADRMSNGEHVSSFTRAFVDTNLQMHHSDIDDSMSGTTAIVARIKGRKLYVCNVGDSRATLGEVRPSDGALRAVDLSHDQTPFRDDECQRVKAAGARVLTLDQLEGVKDPTEKCWGAEDEDDGDPPRVWVQNGMYPGTAFTRSIGDAVAERIGVFAEPEITERELTANSRYIVLASDGVFEFIPSKTVLDMVCEYGDVQEAALALVTESYKNWLQYEVRTDDITCIVIQVLGLEDKPEKRMARTSIRQARISQQGIATQTPGSAEVNDTDTTAAERPGDEDALPRSLQRPARRRMVKRRHVVIESGVFGSGVGGVNGGTSTWEGPPADQPAKTSEQLAAIARAVKKNFLFSHVSEDKRRMLFEAMTPRQVTTGETIIKQGESGDHFYVIEHGKFEVYINGIDYLYHGATMDSEQTETSLGDKIVSYDVPGPDSDYSGPPPAFGELALMYDKPRSATVLATSDGSLWVLHREAFKAIMMSEDSDGKEGMLRTARRVLSNVELLGALHSGQMHLLGDALVQKTFEEGETIIKQGDIATTFFIVISGEIACSVKKHADNVEEEPKEVMRYKPGDYFGERALLANSKALQTVKPIGGGVTVMCITRTKFEETLGRLQAIINADKKFRERNTAQREMNAQLESWGAGELVSPGTIPPPLRLSTGSIGAGEEETLPSPQSLAQRTPRSSTDSFQGTGRRLPISPRCSISFTSPRASGNETLRRNSSLAHLTIADVTTTDVLYTTSVSQLCLGNYVPSTGRLSTAMTGEPDAAIPRSRVVTVKQYSLSLAHSGGPSVQAVMMRERRVMKSLTPMPFIPANMGWARDEKYLTVVINTNALCTLDNVIVTGGPLATPAAVQYYTASMALALEHLHMCGAVYRGTYPETLIIDENGRVQLTDFRLCKVLDGVTYTLCGAPEFLAPEQVEGLGHNQAADWWSLGVLLYYLHTGDTPFAPPRYGLRGTTPATPQTENTAASSLSPPRAKPRVSAEEVTEEKELFRRITDLEYTFPPSVPELSRSLISELLIEDAKQRLGYGTGGVGRLQKHPFFEGLDWDRLMSLDDDVHQKLVPLEMVERLGTLTPIAVEPLVGTVEYNGDTEWFKDF